MIYNIVHESQYQYADVVSMSHNAVHLAARTYHRQTRLGFDLDVSVAPAVESTQLDYFGNHVNFFTIQEPHKRIRLRAVNQVEVHPDAPPDPASTMPWEAARDAIRAAGDAEALDAYQYAFDSPFIPGFPELAEYAAPSFPPGRPLLEAVLDLTRRIHAEFAYDPNATSLGTTLEELLEIRRGVCQDFAHLEIGGLRALGLAARYVSGYLLTDPPPGKPRLVGVDASHAWLAVYLPGFGWVEVDPTNDMLAADRHIVLAWGRDYDDVSPIKGVLLGGGHHTVTVAVDVTPHRGPAGASSG